MSTEQVTGVSFICHITSLSSGYGYGSLMWIPLETAFVNPDNILPLGASCLSPNATRDECDDDTPKYFTDEDLLERFS